MSTRHPLRPRIRPRPPASWLRKSSNFESKSALGVQHAVILGCRSEAWRRDRGSRSVLVDLEAAFDQPPVSRSLTTTAFSEPRNGDKPSLCSIGALAEANNAARGCLSGKTALRTSGEETFSLSLHRDPWLNVAHNDYQTSTSYFACTRPAITVAILSSIWFQPSI